MWPVCFKYIFFQVPFSIRIIENVILMSREGIGNVTLYVMAAFMESLLFFFLLFIADDSAVQFMNFAHLISLLSYVFIL